MKRRDLLKLVSAVAVGAAVPALVKLEPEEELFKIDMDCSDNNITVCEIVAGPMTEINARMGPGDTISFGNLPANSTIIETRVDKDDYLRIMYTTS